MSAPVWLRVGDEDDECLIVYVYTADGTSHRWRVLPTADGALAVENATLPRDDEPRRT